MALTLSFCEDADMHRFFEILTTAFGMGHEYINTIKTADPTGKFLKVTDSETGEIIGVAKWNVYDGDVPPEDGLGTTEFWESEDMAAYADALYRAYLVERRAAVRESSGHLLALDILAVDPKHHFRGAGRMLVDWGTKKADEMNVEAVVETSVHGRHLYETCGFRKLRHVTVHPPDRWAYRLKRQRFFWDGTVKVGKNERMTKAITGAVHISMNF
ncbi:hypothetical protein MMC14_001193 [Varicellaria rhodocarpa]|nr:hypothetical protein [Varicellaria rhodocarpa]